MNLCGGHSHGYKRAHQCGIARLAVGVAQHGQRLAGLGEVLVVDKVGEAFECWGNLFVIDLRHRRLKVGVVTAGGGA